MSGFRAWGYPLASTDRSDRRRRCRARGGVTLVRQTALASSKTPWGAALDRGSAAGWRPFPHFGDVPPRFDPGLKVPSDNGLSAGHGALDRKGAVGLRYDAVGGFHCESMALRGRVCSQTVGLSAAGRRGGEPCASADRGSASARPTAHRTPGTLPCPLRRMKESDLAQRKSGSRRDRVASRTTFHVAVQHQREQLTLLKDTNVGRRGGDWN